MATLIGQTTLEEKVRDFCGTIVEEPDFADAHRKIELFVNDASAQQVYRAWQEKDYALHVKRREGGSPTDREVAEIERLQAAVREHEVASDFVEAEAFLNGMFGTVAKIVQKSLQLGRVPTEQEMQDSGCCGGGGCGCH